ALSDWLISAAMMPLDYGALVFANMPIHTKISSLKKLYGHSRNTETANVLAALKKEHDKHVEARNMVAHATSAGVLKSDPTTIVFSPVAPAFGQPGQMQVVMIPFEVMARATGFALYSAEVIRKASGRFVAPRQQPMP
ncbi:MAG: hypothetical protein ACXW3D_10890, partial [Caulobacteraceae bacterium]